MERISWTAGNVYDKLDKRRFMLFPNEPQKPTVFVDGDNLIRERNPRPTNITDEQAQQAYEEFMEYMDKLEAEWEEEKEIPKTKNMKK